MQAAVLASRASDLAGNDLMSLFLALPAGSQKTFAGMFQQAAAKKARGDTTEGGPSEKRGTPKKKSAGVTTSSAIPAQSPTSPPAHLQVQVLRASVFAGPITSSAITDCAMSSSFPESERVSSGTAPELKTASATKDGDAPESIFANVPREDMIQPFPRLDVGRNLAFAKNSIPQLSLLDDHTGTGLENRTSSELPAKDDVVKLQIAVPSQSEAAPSKTERAEGWQPQVLAQMTPHMTSLTTPESLSDVSTGNQPGPSNPVVKTLPTEQVITKTQSSREENSVDESVGLRKSSSSQEAVRASKDQKLEEAFAAPSPKAVAETAVLAIGGEASRPQKQPTATAGQSDTSTSVVDPSMPADITESRPAVAFHALHLTEQMSGPELRFTWHSPESGEIQLTTSLHQHDVQMTVNTDRVDTAGAMRADLPNLDHRLQEHSLRLGDVSIVAHERTVSTGLGMEGQQRGNREWNAPGNNSNPEISPQASTEKQNDNAGSISNGEGRISVLA